VQNIEEMYYDDASDFKNYVNQNKEDTPAPNK